MVNWNAWMGVLALLGAGTAASHGPKPAGKLPRASATLNAGDMVTVNGVLYQVQVTPVLVPVATPPPPPPPPPPKPTVTGIRNRATGLLVTTAMAGTLLSLEGTGLGTGTGRAQFAGRLIASPTLWSATSVQFPAPDPGGVALTGNWDIYQPSGSGWALVASFGPFTLAPGGTPPPPPTAMPLMVTGFRNAMGQLAASFLPGSTIFIRGQGFGASAGRVLIGNDPALVLQWTDTEIQVRCPARAPGPVQLTVTSATGLAYDRLKGLVILAPP